MNLVDNPRDSFLHCLANREVGFLGAHRIQRGWGLQGIGEENPRGQHGEVCLPGAVIQKPSINVEHAAASGREQIINGIGTGGAWKTECNGERGSFHVRFSSRPTVKHRWTIGKLPNSGAAT